jgi:TonB family protein
LGIVRRSLTQALVAAFITVAVVSIYSSAPCFAQEALTRKVRTRVAPTYPEIARRFAISGTVRLAVVVAPNGNVKTTTAVGGHPLLLNAAMDAVKKWKFEPAAEESAGTIEIPFTLQDK